MRSNKHLLCLWLALATVFFLVQVVPSVAQMPGIPKLYGEFKMPEVGGYASYKVTYKESKAEQMVRLAVVGKEKSKEGKELYWYERQETNPKTGVVVIAKMLISGNPQEIGTIHRMIFKSGKDPASELPQAFVNLLNQPISEESKVEEPKVKELGAEKVKVGDKTLECKHLMYGSKEEPVADVWINDLVPLFGVVKSDSKQVTMELVDYGADAVSGIKEEPEVLEMPQGK
jgi:hypothetical protein